MELPIAVPAKCRLREVIQFLNARGVQPIEIHRQLIEVCGAGCIDVKNICNWRREFKAGHTEIHNEERTARPSVPDLSLIHICYIANHQL